MVNVECEEDGQEFEVNFSDIEEYKQAGKRFLCPSCEEKATEVEEIGEPKRRFEYTFLSVSDVVHKRESHNVCTRKGLNELGREGWEALAVLNNEILLKREYFE